MIILGGAFHNKNYFEESRYTLQYLGINNLSKEELNDYLRN